MEKKKIEKLWTLETELKYNKQDWTNSLRRSQPHRGRWKNSYQWDKDYISYNNFEIFN